MGDIFISKDGFMLASLQTQDSQSMNRHTLVSMMPRAKPRDSSSKVTIK